MSTQHGIGEPELDRARIFVEKLPWKFTTALAAHSYCSRAWLEPEEQQTFDWLEGVIERAGYTDRFRGQRWHYLNIGAYRIWFSKEWYGQPGGRMINRAALADDPQTTLEVT